MQEKLKKSQKKKKKKLKETYIKNMVNKFFLIFGNWNLNPNFSIYIYESETTFWPTLIVWLTQSFLISFILM